MIYKAMEKQKGQFMTTNENLQNKLIDFIKNEPDTVLEPSVGQGHLIKKLFEKKPGIKVNTYEIDKKIKPIIPKKYIKYKDFLKENITKKYKTIIGNPPFVKTDTINLYLQFIEKCFNLLDEKGELIFIVPSDFFKLTSSSQILKNMYQNGSFTDIYHPHNEHLFKSATIDVLIFRYCLDESLPKKCLYNDEEKSILINDGIIIFSNTNLTRKIKDYFKVSVGLVSAKENVFQNNILGNIDITTDFDENKKYILLKDFPSENIEIDSYLIKNKKDLLNRKIRKFNEDNWWQWGALRNYELMKDNRDLDCIYVRSLTRKNIIATTGKVNYFGAKLIMLLPKSKMEKEELKEIVDFMNSEEFVKNHTYSGRFKIGHKELMNILF